MKRYLFFALFLIGIFTSCVDNVDVVYTGIDPEYFNPKHRDESFISDKKKLIFVGNPFDRKGLEDVIRALPVYTTSIFSGFIP